MEVKLLRADVDDAKELHAMQIKSFRKLLEKYQDFDTSPANESVEKVEARLKQEFTYFYFICVGTQKAGAIRIVDKKETGKNKRISPIFILPEFQGQGIAQKAIRLCEEMHGKEDWELITILQEQKNCYLYEKMGYRQTGKKNAINERFTLVFYEKKGSKMQERTIMIFPQFSNQEIIDGIRNKYDPLYNLVNPHITLAFPFKINMPNVILSQKLEECLKETVSFPLVLQGISKHKDTYGNYIFLNVKKGSQEIVKIHNDLYLNIFGEKNCQPFIPHMTIGNLDSADKMEQAYDSVKDMDICFTTIIEKVSVEMIGNNGESNIIIEKRNEWKIANYFCLIWMEHYFAVIKPFHKQH